MSNIITFQNLEAPAPFQGQAVSDFIANIREMAGKYEFVSDDLALSVNAALSSTDVDVKASAGKVYGVLVVSPDDATNGVNVWLYNTNAPNVGVTVPRLQGFCPAGETVVLELFSAGSANVFTSAISVACTSASSLSAAPDAADRPTVTVLYA